MRCCQLSYRSSGSESGSGSGHDSTPASAEVGTFRVGAAGADAGVPCVLCAPEGGVGVADAVDACDAGADADADAGADADARVCVVMADANDPLPAGVEGVRRSAAGEDPVRRMFCGPVQ